MKNKGLKYSLITANFIITLSIVLFAFSIIIFMWIQDKQQQFETDILTLRSSYIEEKQNTIKNEVDEAILFIRYQETLIEDRLRLELKSRIDDGMSILQGIYVRYHETESEAFVKELMKEALREIRFFDGRGYYYINELGGLGVMHPFTLSYEGTYDLYNFKDSSGEFLLRNIIDVVQEVDEGFISYYYYRPDSEEQEPKLSFSKLFKPYNWILSTGEYEKEITRIIQEETIRRLREIRYDEDGYLFIDNSKGDMIMHPISPELEGTNVSEVTDPNGKNIFSSLMDSAHSVELIFVDYLWSHPGLGENLPKIAYARHVDEWDWLVGSGLYMHRIDEIIQAKRIILEDDINQRIRTIFLWGLLTILLCIILIQIYSSSMKKSFNLFSSFFEKASTENVLIDQQLVNYKEFKQLSLLANNMLESRNEIQKQLSDRESRMNALVSALPDMTFLKDENGKYLEAFVRDDHISKSGGLVRGSAIEELIGKYIHDFFDKETADYFLQAIKKTLETNEINTINYELNTTIGLRYYEARIAPTTLPGKSRVIIWVARDVTDLKKLTMDLEASKEDAESATRAKSDFLANMSHEIRTPMNAIIGLSHLIQKTEMTEKQKDYIGKIYKSAHNLLGIINDILDFSKIEAGKLNMESIDFTVNDVFDTLASIIGSKAKEKNLQLSFNIDSQIPAYLIGDPLRLGQVLLNLSNNAIKFTEKGEIEVSVTCIKEVAEKAYLEFRVKDSGVGLTEEQKGKLFQAFSQADTSTTRKYGGTGLGLSISKKIIELMGGEIGVHSVFSEGSTFYFTANFDIQTDVKKVFIEDKNPDLSLVRGAKILLAEDNEINQQVAREILESEGFYVDIANNGREAVQSAERKEHDIILMDLQMPVLDGYEATIEIRVFRDQDDLPIVAMTADAMTGVRDRVIESGMNDYITKPIDTLKLWKTLIRWIKSERRELPPGFVIPDKIDKISTIPEIDGLNTVSGLQRVAGNEKLYRKLLKEFIDEYSEFSLSISNLLKNDNYDDAIRLAHSVKGVSGNLGAGNLQKNMADIEQRLKEGTDVNDSLALVDKFIKDLVSRIEDSGVLIDNNIENKSREDISEEELSEKLGAAIIFLQERKPKPAMEILDSLNEFELSGEIRTQLDQAGNYLAKYKMKEAKTVLEDLKH